MASDPFETFVMFYTAWQELEISLAEFKQMVIEEVGQSGFDTALGVFRSKRLEREAEGSKKTLHDTVSNFVPWGMKK